ncbi:cytochrome b-c1 complex subunit 7 [Penicillium ochrochloron]
MSAPSISNYIVKRPWLKRWMTPIAQWYTDAAGYRRLGLKFDDLIPEESETVQKAIKRLSSKEAYDRVFRLRRAVQDVEYLSPIIREIEKEAKERAELDNLVVRK